VLTRGSHDKDLAALDGTGTNIYELLKKNRDDLNDKELQGKLVYQYTIYVVFKLTPIPGDRLQRSFRGAAQRSFRGA